MRSARLAGAPRRVPVAVPISRPAAGFGFNLGSLLKGKEEPVAVGAAGPVAGAAPHNSFVAEAADVVPAAAPADVPEEFSATVAVAEGVPAVVADPAYKASGAYDASNLTDRYEAGPWGATAGVGCHPGASWGAVDRSAPSSPPPATY